MNSMDATISSMQAPNIFGFFRYFVKFSPYNCGKGPLRIFPLVFSLATFCSMLFRTYWMFHMAGAEFLSFGWAEQNLFAFIALESFPVVIALFRMTSRGSITNFETKMGALQTLRLNRNRHETHDNYGKLYIRLLILYTPILISFVLTSIYLVSNHMVTYGGTDKNSWYPYVDAAVSFLCAYVNFIFLPIHVLLHTAIHREFLIFNEELEEASKNKELTNIRTFQQFGDRQQKLMEYANLTCERMTVFMAFAPFNILTAVTNGTYMFTNFGSSVKLLYFLCIIAVTICTIIIASGLMYPMARVQEAMLHTSNILMNDTFIPTNEDSSVYRCYRMMVDRSMYNRSQVNVIRIFAVNIKNVERAFFIITQIVLVMVVFHGVINGFGQVSQVLMAKGPTV